MKNQLISIKSIFLNQINIIKLYKQFILRQKKNKVDVSINYSCYFPNWGESYGDYILKILQKKINIKDRFYYSLREIYNYYNHSDLQVFKNNYVDLKKYSNLVLSWGTDKDFDINGNFYDRYFNKYNLYNKNTLWIIIYQGKDLEFKNNVENLIIVKKKREFIINFLFFNLNNFLYFSVKSFFANKKTIFDFIKITKFDYKLKDLILKILKNNNFEKIIVPYEGQPFQNYIFNEIQKLNIKILTIGYVHSSLSAFPSIYLKREGHPKKILIHGLNNKIILSNFLNWKKNDLYITESARFLISKKKLFKNKIFLPYSINNPDFLIKKFEIFLKKSKDKSLPIFAIKNHPLMSYSLYHIKFIKSINKLILKNKKKFSYNNKNNLSICFGVTNSVIEALERKVNVLHIFYNPVFESFNTLIWKDIKIEILDNNIYKYSLKKNGVYIKFGKKIKKISTWLSQSLKKYESSV